MYSIENELQKCCHSLRQMTDFLPEIALVLGSGLGDFAETIDIRATADYRDIAGFPVSTVSLHRGRYVFGYIEDIPLVIMQGRIHYYEGYPMDKVVLPIRLMKLLGAKILCLTNAAGSLHPDFRPGDLMLIRDQISNFVPSPLIGENSGTLGERFPDMSEIYNKKISDTIKKVSLDLNIPLREGTYIQLTGPNFESPAEIRMCRGLGGDVVGMSTACEAIAARHMGMKVCGLSCVTNLGCGIGDQPLSAGEVTEIAARTAPLFQKLLRHSIIALGQQEHTQSVAKREEKK